MTIAADQEKLLALIERHGGNDREIALLIGTHPSTVWRLRNREIQKVRKYLDLMIKRTPSEAQAVDNGEFNELVALAKRSPALRMALLSLQSFLQEDASSTVT